MRKRTRDTRTMHRTMLLCVPGCLLWSSLLLTPSYTENWGKWENSDHASSILLAKQ